MPAGECGEVAEIFQWKETLLTELTAGRNPLSAEEQVHIGEEIADVLIYTCRLCDICCIDLGRSVSCILDGQPVTKVVSAAGQPWEDISFQTIALCSQGPFESHRAIAMKLQEEVGRVCNSMSSKSELLCVPGLPAWQAHEVEALAHSLGSIIILLCALAKMTNIMIAHVAADKFAKNEAKYPVAQAKGSSAKYTAYSKKPFQGLTMVQAITAIALVGVVSFSMGARFK